MKHKDRPHGEAPAHDADAPSPYRKPSKSQLKRDMTALQELGEALLRLQPSKLKRLPLPPDLVDAIELAQRITSREGLRRQRQYIGRLMRDVDAQPIRDALSVDGTRHRSEVARMHTAEHWRDRMLAAPDALAQFLAEHPGAAVSGATGPGTTGSGTSGTGTDAPVDWTALIEAARQEKSRDQPGRSYRDLYRLLYRVLEAESGSTAGSGGAHPAHATDATADLPDADDGPPMPARRGRARRKAAALGDEPARDDDDQ